MERTTLSEHHEFGLPSIGIPAEILLHPTLTETEKLLFGLIRNLSYTEKGCWASNRWLGEMLGKQPQTITNAVGNLKKQGFIWTKEIKKANGRVERRIYVDKGYEDTYADMLKEAYKNINRGVLKNLYRGIKIFIPPYKNRISKKVREKDKEKDSDMTSSKTEKHTILNLEYIPTNLPITDSKFEVFWLAYPKNRKPSKGRARKIWERLCNRKDPPSWNTIMEALKNQKKTEQWQNERLIPLVTTWLNQERWEDDVSQMISFKTHENGQRKKTSIGFQNDWHARNPYQKERA